MIIVESALEKDYCFHLDADRSVLKYFPQPITFLINSEQLKDLRYTPDFEVQFLDGRKAYVEVKKEFESLDAFYLHKLQLVSVEIRRRGYEFFFVDAVSYTH